MARRLHPPAPKPLLERLMRLTTVTDTCWLWNGAKYDGYGRIGPVPPAKGLLLVHRVTYEAHVGPIPEGLQLDHLCRVRHCCNPAHLESVTHQENIRRAMRAHCIRGHEFTPENTYEYRGGRLCRTCRKAYMDAFHGRAAALKAGAS